MSQSKRSHPLDTILITLEATEWNLVLGALQEAPYRIAAPLIGKIVAQAEEHRAALASPPVNPTEPRPNGADDHAPH